MNVGFTQNRLSVLTTDSNEDNNGSIEYLNYREVNWGFSDRVHRQVQSWK
jgi:hypothetical protein